MKYLKKFEHFTGQDLGRFSDEDEKNFMLNPNEAPQVSDEDEDEMFYSEDEDESEDDTYQDEREDERGRVWGDEVVEKKKINAGLQAFLDKQKAKKAGKEDKKEEKGDKKAKPDFLDLDKDGDKKEPMKKAAKDAKEDKKEEKGGKELTAAQKKLPEGLRKAIEAKNKKK